MVDVVTRMHTAGPWSVHPYTARGLLEANRERPAYEFDDIAIGAGETIVARVNFHTLPAKYSGYPTVSDREEHEANARLIMVAPQLLDALRGMVGLVQLIESLAPALQQNHRFIEALAVIAKAEGRS